MKYRHHNNAFWRYDPTADTWSTLTNAPGNVNRGGGLTTNGTLIYASRGGGNSDFWSYYPGTNTWTVTITYTDVNGCTATVNRNLSLILPSSPERAACDLAAHSQNIIGWMMRMVGILGLLVVLHRQGVARTITIPTGSFIVNMGVTPQTVAGNFSASGEQHDLAHNYHVPINKSNRLAEAAISNRENPASNHTKQDIGLTGHTKQFGEL